MLLSFWKFFKSFDLWNLWNLSSDERWAHLDYEINAAVETKTKLYEETKKRICQEVCMPFVVEYETMTSFPQCNQCLHDMDSYDSGFHSECRDYGEKEDIHSEERPIIPASSAIKLPDDIAGPRLPWFHPPPSEGYSLTSLKSEDIEQEILRINKFVARDDDKGWI